ncbi:hypothetical protein [Parafrankia sp. EUN1f]|uniref:hypothetical protein n=1 Tax=Parafrankia sp. EUN1f TaxID=102897 RepID=UPI0001C439BD|nr:hypothetical protein [Parafrankia sp. EUN1f]EFC85733.1 hypothetical protein FrEUN1fDRAFT_1221 [Parafrankia sp. EUN1f]
MRFRRSIRKVTSLEAATARNDGLTTLADILRENADRHAAGSHGPFCRGGCVEVTRTRWTAAGWR